MKIDAGTKLAGLLGTPVAASVSPRLHNRAFQAHRVNALYLAFDVRPGCLAAAIAALKSLSFLGANITIPYKEEAIRYLDALSDEVELVGAVNTVALERGRLVGYNTDGQGFLHSLRLEADFSVQGKKTLLIGAGGAARSLVASLMTERAGEIWVLNRTESRAHRLAAELKGRFAFPNLFSDSLARLKDASFLSEFDLVANCTPAWMDKPFFSLAFSSLPAGALIYDLAYSREGTPFLQQASQAGLKTLGGLGMLVHQAALSFQIWTGIAAPHQLMREEAEKT
ncbi:MAG: shikimate dehydrogenase [Thermodesulfobacteriota bacterium]